MTDRKNSTESSHRQEYNGCLPLSSCRRQTRAPFSFHCRICYQGLNLTTRTPVVLPCGHTYLCEPCSKRLDKCMECQTPLSLQIKRSITTTTTAAEEEEAETTPVCGMYSRNGMAPRRPVPARSDTMRSSHRDSHHHHQPQHQHPASSSDSRSGGSNRHRHRHQKPQRRIQIETKPLPIPKNHVLMCLIDAVLHQSSRSTPASSDTDNGKSDNDSEYKSGDDDELVLQGMKLMGRSSGTYVVREREGLIVHPFSSKSSISSDFAAHVAATGDVDGNDIDNQISIVREPIQGVKKTLKYGQTVQIFLFENKIATIARRAGYILVTNDSQLVKVGEVTDEACKLEAANKVLTMEMKSLEIKLARLRQAQDRAQSRLQEVLASTSNHDVFGPVPAMEGASKKENIAPKSKTATSSPAKRKKKSKKRRSPVDPLPPIMESQSFEEHSPVSVLPSVPSIQPSRSFEGFTNYLASFQSGEDKKTQDGLSEYLFSYWPFQSTAINKETKPANKQHRPSSLSYSPRILDTIDFTSGLSGHRGLGGGGGVANRVGRPSLSRKASSNGPPEGCKMMMSRHSGVWAPGSPLFAKRSIQPLQVMQ